MKRLDAPLRTPALFKMLVGLSALVASTLCISTHAFAGNKWVTVSGNASAAECVDAKALAHHMFYSKAPLLYGPLTIPDTLNSTLVLGATEKDVSGGGPVSTRNETYFVHQAGSGVDVDWGQTTDSGMRLVLTESNRGWRGDTYSLYQVDAKLSPDEWAKTESSAPAILSDAWRPPLIFNRNDTHALWFIDVDQSGGPLADWGVYGYSGSQYEKLCDLKFISDKKRLMSGLPSSVLRLGALLDATLGPGNNEGTLQSTARLRGEVVRIWTNIEKRPWSLSESDVYNSRDEVDSGLSDWAERGPKAHAVYEDIKKQYPVAERALSNYFHKTFQLNPERARQLAAWALDIAMRSHYAFPNGTQYFRYDDVNTNPWWQ